MGGGPVGAPASSKTFRTGRRPPAVQRSRPARATNGTRRAAAARAARETRTVRPRPESSLANRPSTRCARLLGRTLFLVFGSAGQRRLDQLREIVRTARELKGERS